MQKRKVCISLPYRNKQKKVIMKTIRKNTKEFNEVLNMKNWNEFSLENCFKPEVVESINVDYAMSFLKLQKDNGKYILSIHSNRWFELSVN